MMKKFKFFNVRLFFVVVFCLMSSVAFGQWDEGGGGDDWGNDDDWNWDDFYGDDVIQLDDFCLNCGDDQGDDGVDENDDEQDDWGDDDPEEDDNWEYDDDDDGNDDWEGDDDDPADDGNNDGEAIDRSYVNPDFKDDLKIKIEPIKALVVRLEVKAIVLPKMITIAPIITQIPDFKPEITTQLVKNYNTTTKTNQASAAVVQAEVKAANQNGTTLSASTIAFLAWLQQEIINAQLKDDPTKKVEFKDCEECHCSSKIKCEQTWYLDNDKDGYHAETKEAVEAPTGGNWVSSTSGEDCDDTNANRKTTEDCEKCKTIKEDLKKMFPNASDTTLTALSKMINKYAKNLGIDSKVKLQHLLSQTGHETGGYKKLQVTESTYWTTASKLANTYSKFTNDSIAATKDNNLYYAKDYLRDSKGVANVAMCCKYGNGDVASGDGYKYRGRGIMQLTWKNNYKAFQKWYNDNNDIDIDLVKNPNLLSTNNNLAVLSGMWYYKTRVLDKIKDFNTKATVDNVTKKINSAKKGIKDRKAKHKTAKKEIDCN